MQKIIIPLLAIVFIGAILLYMCSYSVRFTELAVKTTFGSADENSIVTEPGLHWKAPYPIQSVTKYDQRLRLVRTRSETQQTADDFQVVVESFMTYRVSDPLKFFRSFSNAGDRAIDHYRKAENDILRDLLRSALGETSRYGMSDLFASSTGISKLPELEGRVYDLLSTGGEGGVPLSDYGIEVVSVGIDRIVLPEGTTETVISRMGASRDRLAEEFESKGRADAASIRAAAASDAEKIRAFADRRAREIVARGEAEAVPYLAAQNTNPELAVFLERIDHMREAMAKKFTLVLSESDFGLDLYSPGVLDDVTREFGLEEDGR